MSLTRVEIENFRCIEQLGVDLDETTVLIGENNSGKTAFLDAIRICLDPRFRRRPRTFDDYDYRLSQAGASPAEAPPIRVELTFVEKEPGEWSEEQAQEFEEVSGRDPENRIRIRLRVTSSFRDGTDWDFLTETGVSAASPTQISLLQRLAPVHYLSALRDAEKSFAPRAPFWRDFLEESGIPEEERAVLERELHDLNARVVEQHAALSTVRGQLEVVTRVIDFAAANAVRVDAIPVRLFALLSGTRVSLAARSGAPIPLRRQGQGTQSLAVLALFAAYLRSRSEDDGEPEADPITALEEPEAHLHPAAVRALAQVLEEIPGQKLIATHSGDLMAEVSAGRLRRFAPDSAGVAAHRITPGGLTPEEERSFDAHIRRTRGELLFARCWLLVEGETEVVLFAGAARALGLDLEQAGVRLVPFAGSNLGMFVAVAGHLGIRWLAVVDGDRAGERYRLAVGRRVEASDPDRVLTPYESPEMCLCENGFGAIYEARMSDRKELPSAPRGAGEYWREVLRALPQRTSKPAAAAEAVERMTAEDGPAAVPAPIDRVLRRALALAGEA